MEKKKRFKGCLLTVIVAFIAIIIGVKIAEAISIKRYKTDPAAAREHIVEGFAGIEFPPYNIKEVVMGPTNWMGDYSDTIKLEFETLPDNSFFERVETACKQEYQIEKEDRQEIYRPWNSNGSGGYYFSLSYYNNHKEFDTFRSIFMTRGVPEEFLDTDLTYEIRLSKDSKEWTIIVGAK